MLPVHVSESVCECVFEQSGVIPLNLFSCSDLYFRAWGQCGQQLPAKDVYDLKGRGSRNTERPLTPAHTHCLL